MQSISPSFVLEEVVGPGIGRAAKIIDGSVRGLRSRNEQEFAGDRSASG